jgi:hypothetical protein
MCLVVCGGSIAVISQKGKRLQPQTHWDNLWWVLKTFGGESTAPGGTSIVCTATATLSRFQQDGESAEMGECSEGCHFTQEGDSDSASEKKTLGL